MRASRWSSIILAAVVPACGGDDAPSTEPDASPGGSSDGAACVIDRSPGPGLTETMLDVAGQPRRYLLHLPPAERPVRALVVVLHGGGGEGATGVSEIGGHPLSVFRTVADREGFAVVYPDGVDESWNDCRGDAVVLSTADDVAFLDAVLDTVGTQLCADRERTFVAGGSNGALMTYRYAFERAERIAAIATSSGNLPEQPEAGRCGEGPARPLPLLMTHGTDDPQMPTEGGCVSNFGGGCNRGRVVSTAVTIERWLAYAGVTSPAPATREIDLDTDDPGPAVERIYQGGVPVHAWTLTGAGHPAPSIAVQRESAVTGPQNHDIEFAEVSWAFFATVLD